MSESWSNGLCDCCSPFGTCCEAFWCPCILFGKTNARANDPSLASYSCCNGSCCGWFTLSLFGFQGFLQCASRGDLRQRYNVHGDACTDCLVSCCCVPCGLVQEAKEVTSRTARQQGYQPAPQMMYQSQQPQMEYQQQPHQQQHQVPAQYQMSNQMK